MGRIIVFEGLDGSGKETQSKFLTKTLIEKNKKVKRIEYPNYNEESSILVKLYLNGKIKKNLFEINPYAATSFYASDHFISYKKNWEKFYKQNYIIIADRYVSSNAIYQMAKLEKKDWQTYLNWLYDYEFSKLKLPKEDLTIYLDVLPEISKNLIEIRNIEKDIHEQNFSYLEKCRETALFLAKKLKWHVIKCYKNEKMLNKEDIAKNIEFLIEKLFFKGENK